jgi:bifunctional NMN adenylyltransferase/nudix hydrolase
MLENLYPKDIVRSVQDIDDDAVWSTRIDQVISEFTDKYDDIVLYGSRDSFLLSYSGKHKIDYYVSVINASATEKRKLLKNAIVNSTDFRHGIIYAVENRFPVAFHTVDIALIRGREDYDNIEVLLCRKPDMNRWGFIGGFIDPSDESAEDAALRELGEEIADETTIDDIGQISQNPLVTTNPIYVGSSKIDDPRYRGTNDSVLTTFFKIDLLKGNPTPAIDKNGFTELAEVKWVYVKDIMKHISYIHNPLAEKLLSQHSKYTI